MYRACPWSSWTIPAVIVVETWVKNYTVRLHSNHSIGMRSYLPKSNFKFNLQKHHFVCLWSIIKCYLNFINCLYFPLALIRWNSSHCHLMELFKTKESCRKNLFPTVIEKLHGQEWFYSGIIRICMKNVEFCKKTSTFYPKDVCLFIFCIFYLN